jgi:hypothetical protein
MKEALRERRQELVRRMRGEDRRPLMRRWIAALGEVILVG